MIRSVELTGRYNRKCKSSVNVPSLLSHSTAHCCCSPLHHTNTSLLSFVQRHHHSSLEKYEYFWHWIGSIICSFETKMGNICCIFLDGNFYFFHNLAGTCHHSHLYHLLHRVFMARPCIHCLDFNRLSNLWQVDLNYKENISQN